MKIVSSLEDIPSDSRPVVLTIGNFDGLHLGHQAVLANVKNAAMQSHGCTTVVTFQQHPSEVLYPTLPVLRLVTPQHKIRLLKKLEIDILALLPFTLEFSQQTAEAFLNVLFQINPFSQLILGHDAVIGKNRQGDRKTIEALAQKLNFQVKYLEPVLIDDAPVSSSQIRRHLQNGDLKTVQRLLGRPYSIYSKVIKDAAAGDNPKVFPSITIPLEGLCLPPCGIYAVKINYKGKEMPAVANLCLTSASLNSRKPFLEVYLIRQTDDLYDKMIEVVFYKLLRTEIMFSDLEALKSQIANIEFS